MTSTLIRNIDECYSKRITDLIYFFKHLFSVLSNYQVYRNREKIRKFQKLISGIKSEINYFIQSSKQADLLQEKKLLEIKKIEKNEDQLIRNRVFVKPDYEEYKNLIKENNIEFLYHFTAKKNISSIKKIGGLFPWPYFSVASKENSTGGHSTSRLRDAQKGFENYVRLSFCASHPMAYNAKRDGRIDELVVLKIKPELLYHLGTWYSNKNAMVADVNISRNINLLYEFDFSVFGKFYPSLRDRREKDQYQAEILVRRCVPLDYIFNINLV